MFRENYVSEVDCNELGRRAETPPPLSRTDDLACDLPPKDRTNGLVSRKIMALPGRLNIRVNINTPCTARTAGSCQH